MSLTATLENWWKTFSFRFGFLWYVYVSSLLLISGFSIPFKIWNWWNWWLVIRLATTTLWFWGFQRVLKRSSFGNGKCDSSLATFPLFAPPILLMEEILHHLGCFSNRVNNGINYLFLNWWSPDFNHQQYHRVDNPVLMDLSCFCSHPMTLRKGQNIHTATHRHGAEHFVIASLCHQEVL